LGDKFPGTRLSLWCYDHTDIFEIESDRSELYEPIEKEVMAVAKEQNSKIVSKTYRPDKIQLVARTCCCGGEGKMALTPIFRQHNFMEIPPVIFFDGWEYHRLIGYDDADVRGVLKELDNIATTEVLHKKEISEGGITNGTSLVSFNSLFGRLTRKQTMAMISAIENGYYEMPRRATTNELAKRNRQPRSTFEEHIRKAENKVVLAMAPYLMMYARIPASRTTPAMTRSGGIPLETEFRQLVPMPGQE
jgi:predicted DNA binding protein